MPKTYSTEVMPERAVLIGVIDQNQSVSKVNEYLEELSFLVETAGAIPVKKFIQRLQSPHPKTFVGAGKLEEIRTFVEAEDIDLVVFDDELSATQIRNIEKSLERRILDRTHLILDIFVSRAKTAHAKTQVALAQYQYLLPRLTRMWTHLERQKGGIGFRGPGETEIETDRRIVRDKIARLKEELVRIDKINITQRKNRGNMVRVALVGYTNVGKSTLMNLISKSTVFAENKLFATLDTTVRKVVIENLPFLLSDTVGFIRKLPHDLVESFKSTLDEVREADLLLHVVDISHPNFEDQIAVVNATLEDLKANDKPTLMIFNKIDAFQFVEKEDDDLTPLVKENLSLEELKKSWMAKENSPCLFISAVKRENYDALKSVLYKMISEIHNNRYPYGDFLSV